ncbi:MAG: MFS transporter [Succinivibrio sp.]
MTVLYDTRFPKRGWGNIFVASGAHFVGDFYCNLLPVLLPLLSLKFGFSYSQCGMLYMIFQITASLLQAPIGLMADKRNLGFILPLSVLLGGILASSVGLCSNVLVLTIIILLSGICSSGFHPIAGGIVPSVTPKGKEVLATSIFILGGNIGFAVAPFATAVYLEYFSLEQLIYLCALPVIFTMIIIRQKMYIKPVSKSTSETITLSAVLHNSDFIKLVLSIGLRAVCYCALVLYIPLMFTAKGISSISASSVLMTLLIGTAAGGLIVGVIASKFRLKTLISSSYLLTIIMMIIFMSKADDSAVSYISIFLAGIGLYASTPPAIVWAQRLLPNADSFATSMMLGFTFGIGYAISVLIGLLGDYIGLEYALSAFIFPSILLALILIRSVNEAK